MDSLASTLVFLFVLSGFICLVVLPAWLSYRKQRQLEAAELINSYDLGHSVPPPKPGVKH